MSLKFATLLYKELSAQVQLGPSSRPLEFGLPFGRARDASAEFQGATRDSSKKANEFVCEF